MSLGMRLYSQAPVWLQETMLGIYGAKLKRLRYRQVHATTLRELELSQWWTAEEIAANQMRRLNSLLEHARNTVPYYRSASWPTLPVRSVSDLANFPIIRKADVQREGEAFISTAFRRGSLTEIHTGGTTGTPLTIYCDSPAVQRNYAFFSRFIRWTGATSDEGPTATFAGRTIVPPDSGPPYWRRNRASNATLFSSYHISPATLPLYADALAELSPVLIDSYPSSLEPIARHLVATNDGRIRPRAVVTSSETLRGDARGVIERAFACPVFDHYGSAEMVAFVTQCDRGTYHVNPEFGILELLRNGQPVGPGESGEIIATGFVNPVMPLIRYAMGDSATWSTDVCECGRAAPALKELGGRVDDVIETPDGRLVGRLDPIFKSISSLFECRIVQDAADHLRVEIVVGRPLPELEKASLIDGLRARVGASMRIDLVSVDRIPRTAGGKLRAVVREWKTQ